MHEQILLQRITVKDCEEGIYVLDKVMNEDNSYLSQPLYSVIKLLELIKSLKEAKG